MTMPSFAASEMFSPEEIAAMLADLAEPDICLPDLDQLESLVIARPRRRFVPHGSRRVDGWYGNHVFLHEVIWLQHHGGLVVSQWLFDQLGGESAPGNKKTVHYFAKAFRDERVVAEWHERFETEEARALAIYHFLYEPEGK